VVSAAGLSLALASLSPRSPGGPTDYDIELTGLQKEIAELGQKAFAPPIDVERATRFVHRLNQRAYLTGGPGDFKAADAAMARAVQDVGPSPPFYFLKANLDFKFHRLDRARDTLAALSRSGGNAHAAALNASITFQDGGYEEAKREYQLAIEKNPTWDNLARLAYWEAKFGDPQTADRLYEQAEDAISAKGMRSYAWVELERGVLSLKRGRHREALAHYRRAEKAYSGYWLVDEHLAELLGAERKFAEAAALYETVIARAPRPEFQQALGDLLLVMGKADRARPWHERALTAYLESVERGEAHYYHHLTGFYADVRGDGAEAVRWARKDVQLRRNFMTQEALAWALYRNGQFAEALDTIKLALSSGVIDAHLFFHAALIHLGAGRVEEGKRLLQQAADINPRFEEFHVHR